MADAVLGWAVGVSFGQMMRGLEIDLNAVRSHGGYGCSTEYDVEWRGTVTPF